MWSGRNFALGDGYTAQSADYVLLSHSLVTSVVLFTNVTPINSIKNTVN